MPKKKKNEVVTAPVITEVIAKADVVEQGKAKCSVSLDQDVVTDLVKVSQLPDIDRSFSYVVNRACIEYRDKCKLEGLID